MALFDIDKTMVEGMSFLPMLEFQSAIGLLESGVSALAREVERNYLSGILSYEDFVKGLLDTYAWGLFGKPVNVVRESTDQFFEQSSEFFGYVAPTIELLSPTHDVRLVTSNTQFAASAVAKIFGVENFCSSTLGIDDSVLNGRISSYLATRQEKKGAIQHLIDTHEYKRSFAFADSEGDIEILRAVEHPICIKPDTGLRNEALEQGWHIIDSTEELSAKIGLTVVRFVIEGRS